MTQKWKKKRPIETNNGINELGLYQLWYEYYTYDQELFKGTLIDKKENKKRFTAANWIQQYLKIHHDWGLSKEYKASSTLKKQCNSPYLLIKEEKIYDHLDRCRRSLWQYSVPIRDKNSAN